MRYCGLTLSVLILLNVNSAFARSNADQVTIRQTISNYIEGAIKGDSLLMAKAFSEDAYIHGYIDGGPFNGPIQALFDWNSANVPAKDLKYKIAWIDIAGTIATARVELDGWNERPRANADAPERLRKFTDMFVLLKVGSEWKIVSKVFHTQR